jgi:hypothetical protein
MLVFPDPEGAVMMISFPFMSKNEMQINESKLNQYMRLENRAIKNHQR